MMASCIAESGPTENADQPAGTIMNDFSFLIGRWMIRHHRLKESMVNSDEWRTFDTEYEGWPLMHGAGSVDRVFGQVNGDDFEGVSVRTYNKESDEWTIFWMDTSNTTLREQVRGRFENGVGTFYGSEDYQGTSYRMRFLWKDMTNASARWEQAYQDPDTGEWETNWIMEFKKHVD